MFWGEEEEEEACLPPGLGGGGAAKAIDLRAVEAPSPNYLSNASLRGICVLLAFFKVQRQPVCSRLEGVVQRLLSVAAPDASTPKH